MELFMPVGWFCAGVARIYQKYIKWRVVHSSETRAFEREKMPINKALAVVANIYSHIVRQSVVGELEIAKSLLYLYHLKSRGNEVLHCDMLCCADAFWFHRLAIHFNSYHAVLFLTFCYKSDVNLSLICFSNFFSLADHGKIIKAVNAESADSSKKVSSVVIEELDVLPTNEPIRNLEIIRTTQYGKYLQMLHREKLQCTNSLLIESNHSIDLLDEKFHRVKVWIPLQVYCEWHFCWAYAIQSIFVF